MQTSYHRFVYRSITNWNQATKFSSPSCPSILWFRHLPLLSRLHETLDTIHSRKTIEETATNQQLHLIFSFQQSRCSLLLLQNTKHVRCKFRHLTGTHWAMNNNDANYRIRYLKYAMAYELSGPTETTELPERPECIAEGHHQNRLKIRGKITLKNHWTRISSSKWIGSKLY